MNPIYRLSAGHGQTSKRLETGFKRKDARAVATDGHRATCASDDFVLNSVSFILAIYSEAATCARNPVLRIRRYELLCLTRGMLEHAGQSFRTPDE